MQPPSTQILHPPCDAMCIAPAQRPPGLERKLARLVAVLEDHRRRHPQDREVERLLRRARELLQLTRRPAPADVAPAPASPATSKGDSA